jgi:hypothetical protein
MNLAVGLPLDLEEGAEPVHAEIVRQLLARGLRVAVIWPADAELLWRAARKAVQGAPGVASELATAAATFTRALQKEADFDLLVMPSLAVREARLTGQTVRWDGVARRLSVRTDSPAGSRSYPGTGAPLESLVMKPGTAKVPGLSLHVFVLTPEGRVAYQGWGGLDLVHDALAIARLMGDNGLVLAPHVELLGSAEHVREGVSLALDPYLGPAPN